MKNIVKIQSLLLRKRTFTLIELLVVISIISVLSGMMMPALGKTRQTARGISCASNLKQIGVYIENYQASNDGWLAGASGGWCCNKAETANAGIPLRASPAKN